MEQAVATETDKKEAHLGQQHKLKQCQAPYGEKRNACTCSGGGDNAAQLTQPSRE